MTESTSTITPCGNCGIQIVATHDGYVHIPRMEDAPTDCADPSPTKTTRTTTKPVTQTRRTTPAPFAAITCLMGHNYRVVLERNQPIALECVNCATTWKTERIEREQP